MTGNSTAAETLIVFTRYPRPGEVKIRLAATIGDDRACRIHDRLARHTIQQALAWGGDFEVRLTGSSPAEGAGWLGPHRFAAQGDGDLGEKLGRATDAAFHAGKAKAVVIGTDCPALDAGVLRSAFTALDHHDVVFGPAADGGYYLVGIRKPSPDLFRGIAWGGPDVLGQSTAKAPGAALLGVLRDVDVWGDLVELRRLGLPSD